MPINWPAPKPEPCRYCGLNPATFTGACRFCQAKVDKAVQELMTQLKERLANGSQRDFIVGLEARANSYD